MKTIIAFSSRKEIFEILGWPYTGDYKTDEPLTDKLWDAGFNLDDWDIGFACREPLGKQVSDEDYEYDTWFEWDEDIFWLGSQMDSYCVGCHHCEFEGWHWYTVHHA